MTKSEFNRLYDRYQRGTATDEEKARLDAWFESIEINDEFKWDEHDENRQFQAIRNKIDIQLQKKLLPWYSQTWLKMAATLLIVAMSAFLLWHITFRNETITVPAMAGMTEKTILPDGTLVWLKGNSTLQFPEEFEDPERTVVLKGEALFEVTKDPAHPFVIRSGDMKAKVLGTSFNIVANEHEIELMVLTGKVELSRGDSSRIVVLPDEKVKYQGLPEQTKKVMANEEKQEVIKNTDYDMAFNNALMQTVLKRLEKKFNTQVTLESMDIGECRITADFTDQSLEDTLRMIAHILGFEYEIHDRTITITGGGCGNK